MHFLLKQRPIYELVSPPVIIIHLFMRINKKKNKILQLIEMNEHQQNKIDVIKKNIFEPKIHDNDEKKRKNNNDWNTFGPLKQQ